MKIKNILIPVDFSEFSDRAVEHGLMLAKKFGADIKLLHAVVLFQQEPDEKEHMDLYEKYVQRKEESGFKRLQEKMDAAGAGPHVRIESEMVRSISAAEAILEYLGQHPCDLVIIGTHGERGLRRLVFGSVAERVVRLSPVPVLTVQKGLRQDSIARIVVPVDFSAHATVAVKSARVLAKTYNAAISFVHVINQQLHPAYGAANVNSVFVLDPDLKDRSLKNLIGFAGKEAEDDDFRVLEGRPSVEIVNFARDERADLILMGTKGLSGLDHLLIGSVTERVVRTSPVPVLTVGREASLTDN
ncbi:MAG TPA: universal stress protein [Calditrichia bacterium]|nr:universal stress protein [Calditrichia bacterium]